MDSIMSVNFNETKHVNAPLFESRYAIEESLEQIQAFKLKVADNEKVIAALTAGGIKLREKSEDSKAVRTNFHELYTDLINRNLNHETSLQDKDRVIQDL